MIKWIAAFVGYMYFRFAGAIMGFFIGSIVESLLKRNSIGIKGGPNEKFQLNLLSLAAVVIKSDGTVSNSELNFVRNYFITNYGKKNADDIFSKFNSQVKKEKQDLIEIANFFNDMTSIETRLQIVHFLFAVSNADGHVSKQEVNKILEISRFFSVNIKDFESIKAMFIKNADNAYKILEVDPSCTDSELKKAYRDMVKKYHPDKILSKDPALIRGSKEKFQEVQKAYELIQKERGL